MSDITVNTVNLTTSPEVLGTARARRGALIVRNPTGSGATVLIGDANVDDANAVFVLAAGDPPQVIAGTYPGDPLASCTWYAAASTGTATGVVVSEA